MYPIEQNAFIIKALALDIGQLIMALTSKEMANFDPALRLAYDRYVDNIMRGVTPIEAALRSGVTPQHVLDWIRGAETDAYVIALFSERISALNVRDLWSDKLAVLNLRRMASDMSAKGSDRLAAMKELNVLMGITEVDDAGRTVKRRGLADFYAESDAGPKPEGERPLH